MRREHQPVSLWHGEPTLEPRPYETNFPNGFVRYTVRQGDQWDWISYKAYGVHYLYYLILDANGIDPLEEPTIGQEIRIPIL